MHNRRALLILGLMVGAVLLLVILARQIPPPTASRSVVLTQNYELNTALDDSLVVMADTVQLTGQSHVRGDAALIGRGSVRVDGRIDGSLTVMSETLDIGPNAHISGDVAFMGSQMTAAGTIDGAVSAVAQGVAVAASAAITGDVTACADVLEAGALRPNQLQPCRDHDSVSALAALRDVNLAGVITALALPLVIVLAALAALAVAAFPQRFQRVLLTLRQSPQRLARLGCLGLLVTVGLAAALVALLALVPPLGLVLLPLGLLLVLALLLLAGVGWTTVALLAGSWLSRRTGLPPVITVIPGSVVIGLALAALVLSPFGALAALLLAAFTVLGLGAALATRGRRPAITT